MVMDENPLDKIPLGRPGLRWEDIIRKYDEALNGGQDCKALANDRGELDV